MDGRVLMIVLRLLHILGGIFWLGTMFVSAGFLYPAAMESPEGGRLLLQIMVRRRLAMWVSATATVTILSGFWMYGRLASVGGRAWMHSRPAMALGLGGALAIVAMGVAGARVVPAGKRIGELGARLQQAGGPPAAADLAEMQRLQGRLLGGTRLIFGLLVGTAAAMAVSRYLY